MAFTFMRTLRKYGPKVMSNSAARRCIVVPPNSGEPTRTNQEVIQALTQAIIGGTYTG